VHYWCLPSILHVLHTSVATIRLPSCPFMLSRLLPGAAAAACVQVNIDFEPFKPINTSLYMCDNKFHTAALSELLESDNK